jgi:hypothetical protein
VGKSERFSGARVTIILLASIVIGFLQTFDLRLNVVTESAPPVWLALVAG